MGEGWKGDLTPLLDRIAGVATGAGSLLVLAAGSRLALALPSDRRAAAVVTDLYQPQRWKGRVFRALVRSATIIGMPKWHPSYRGAGSKSVQSHWLKDAAAQGMVGFLGCNPNHGPRCVLAGVEPNSGEKFIAKLGLDGSAMAVRREAEVLEQLGKRFPGVVPSMGLETSDATPPAHVPESVFDWALLRLPHLGTVSPGSMGDAAVQELLKQWLGDDRRDLGGAPWASRLLDRVGVDEAPANWHSRMKTRQIRTALLHGDFAVWNLRHTPDGLVAIDWEWGQEDAVGGIDLAHGLRQECYMVRSMEPGRAVAWMLEQAASPRWCGYLETCGWGGSFEDWLRIGLLHSHFNALNPSAELLAVLGIHLKS